MKRSLPLIVVLLSLLLGCRQAKHEAPEVLVRTVDDGVAVQSPDSRQRSEAVLSDARDIYRICTTRPQRLAPSQGSNNQRTPGKLPFAVRLASHQPLFRHYDGRARTETAPFRFVASRHYYIIALRRILR